MRKLAPFLALMLFCGCVRGTPQPASHAVAPPGVVLPRGARAGSIDRGLFIGRSSDGSCCWVTTSATLTFRKPVPAHHLTLVIYVPKAEHGNTVSSGVAIDARFGSFRERRCCFHGGVSAASFDLPRELWNRQGTVTAEFAAAPPSVRNLAFVLMRAFFD